MTCTLSLQELAARPASQGSCAEVAGCHGARRGWEGLGGACWYCRISVRCDSRHGAGRSAPGPPSGAPGPPLAIRRVGELSACPAHRRAVLGRCAVP